MTVELDTYRTGTQGPPIDAAALGRLGAACTVSWSGPGIRRTTSDAGSGTGRSTDTPP